MELNINYNKLFCSWLNFFDDLIYTNYFKRLMLFLHKQYKSKTIYPEKKDIFKAFRLCNYNELKVVILGQDPYMDGSATGLAFANKGDSIRLSPSLDKILQTIEDGHPKLDFDITLEKWAKQGVLLLNTALTVEKNRINSHSKQWKLFTEYVIKTISEKDVGIIFLLWGNHAKSYRKFIDEDFHFVLECTHPSFAARNNMRWKCNHFKEVNRLLEMNNGKKECIEW